MGQRIIGTDNDIEITRTVNYDLENLTVPVLVIHGTKDSLAAYDIQAKAYEKRLPQCKLHTIEGGEHVAIFTHNKEVKRVVSEFMQTKETVQD